MPAVLLMLPLGAKLSDDGTDWPAWITAIATLGLAFAAAAALLSLMDARRTRHGQLLTDLSRRWDEPLAVESWRLASEHDTEGILALMERIYDVPLEKPDPDAAEARRKDLELFNKLCAIPNYIETIGVLRSEKAMSGRVIFRLWGGSIIAAWTTWERPIMRMREAEARPGIYAPFEMLAREMGRLAQHERLAAAESPTLRVAAAEAKDDTNAGQ